MPNLSSFPNQVDQFLQHENITYNDKTNIARYQELVLKVTRTPDEDTELNNLIDALRTKLFLPDDLNFLQDAMENIETFTKDTITNYYAYKGNYNLLNTYSIFNTVKFTDGCIYLALDNVAVNQSPSSNPDKWLQISQKGDTGMKGDRGSDGANLVNRGVYDNTASYLVNDLVKYNTTWYFCIQATTGHIPTNATYWGIFMEQPAAVANAADVSLVDTGNYYTSNNVEGALGEVGDDINTLKTSQDSTNVQLAEYTYDVVTTDSLGKPIHATYKRQDSTLYKDITCSNANTNGYYQTIVEKTYDINGTTLLQTKTYSITYSIDGFILHKGWVIS